MYLNKTLAQRKSKSQSEVTVHCSIVLFPAKSTLRLSLLVRHQILAHAAICRRALNYYLLTYVHPPQFDKRGFSMRASE